MPNLERVKLELEYLQEDFDIQIKRVDKCLELLDSEGAERWLSESRITNSRIKLLS
tara:strand:+ start:285 stop:452 length:168 start_codon:yes stop_codon:yes gene_type:complete